MEKNGSLWGEDAVGTLRVLAAEGYDKVEIADILKRSTLAVTCKARTIGVKFKRADYDSKTRPYSPEEDAIIIRMTAEGYRAATIALKIRRGARGVRRRSLLLGIRCNEVARRFTDRNYKGWGDGRLEDVIARWKRGDSATSIVDAIGGGLTPNAVIGKMNRLGLSRFKKSERPKRLPKASKPKRIQLPQLRPVPPTSSKRFSFKDIRHHYKFTPKEAWVPTAANDTARIAHIELAQHHCRWPVGDPEQVGAYAPLFCGELRKAGLPYCAEHCKRAYTAVSNAPLQSYRE